MTPYRFNVLFSIIFVLHDVVFAKAFDQSVTSVTSYRSLITAGLYDCIAECQASSVCKWVLYKPDSCECRLLHKNVSISDTPEVLYINVNTWKTNLAGQGSKPSCPLYTRCVTLRNGRTRCVDESIPCGAPPEVDNALRYKSNGSEYPAGSVIAYTCMEGFLKCGLVRRTCHKSGSWSRVKGHCVGSSVTFTDPKMSNQKLPCSARRSWNMTIIGTPTVHDFFNIWLFARRRAAVIIRASLSHDNCNDTINMVKTKTTTECGTKVPNVFTTGKPFHIDIIFFQKVYKLLVGNKIIKSLTGDISHKMVITGSVELTNVTFTYS